MDSIEIKPENTGPTAPAQPSTAPDKERHFVEADRGIQIVPEGVEPPRPEWLPQKFKSAEDLAKAYQELEKKIGGQNPEAPAPEVPPAAPPADPSKPPEEPLDQLGEFKKYTDEFSKSGQLSEQSYKELLDRGIPKILVDQYIANYRSAAGSQTAAIEAQIVASVGGPQEYAAMQVWASNNFSKEEIEAFNATMETNDPKLMAFAVQSLKARYQSNAEPKLISAQSNSKPTGFRSMAELTAAMRDPRYAMDPAYRADVAAKMKASTLFGVEQ
jgi:hypothetical protein